MEKPFHVQLWTQVEALWQEMLAHPFLAQTAKGTVPRETFARWMQQDFLYAREAIPFLAVLLSKAPISYRKNLSESIAALHQELELFERMAGHHKVSFQDIRMSTTCHAYSQFMLATAHSRSFEEGFAVLYGAEKAYLDSWTWVKTHVQGRNPWQEFIDHWSSGSFRSYVGWLEGTLDELAGKASTPKRQAMAELFQWTAHYEYLFWEMAAKGEAWPK